MHAYGRSSAPIAQGLVYDINSPHVFGLRESKPKAMHAYGRSSAPIAQGLVYDINAPHDSGLRGSKRTNGPVSTPITQGLVAIINAKDRYIVTFQKAQGLVSNTHHDKKHMLKNYTLDRMSGGKAAKRSNSDATTKKMMSLDETNHAAVSLTPTEDDFSRWVSTLAPLTLLKAASKHATRLNEHRMLYTASDTTKTVMVTPTSVNFGLQMGVGNVYNMEGLMGVDTSDVRKTIMFLMDGHRPTPICVPFEIFADEIHWELFANLFFNIYKVCANISSK